MFSIGTIKRMNAKEALEASKANRKNARTASIKPLLDIAYGAISRATAFGETSIPDPFVGLRMIVALADRQAVFDHLKKDGYSISGGVISWGK